MSEASYTARYCIRATKDGEMTELFTDNPNAIYIAETLAENSYTVAFDDERDNETIWTNAEGVK